MNRAKQKLLSIIFASLLLISCDKKEKEAEPLKKPEPPKPAAVSMLSLVPDDTIFFVGGLEPAPLKEWLQWTAANFHLSKDMLNPQGMQQISEKAATDGQRMAVQIWEEYVALVAAPDAQFAGWGFAEQPQMAFYAIGLAPVCRISLSDAEQFKKKIAELEAKAKVTAAKAETLGGASLRRYALIETMPSVSLIIGTADNEAVLMLDIGVDSEQTLALAFGQSKPEKSLEQSGRLKSLTETHKLHPSWLGYIDHQQIAAGLTTKDGNRMAKMLQLLTPKLQEKTVQQLNELQSEGCRSDVQAIAAKWPQSFFGYTSFDLKAQPARLDSLMVMESTDQPLLDGLKSLRGFVPEYTKAAFAPAVASFAVGLSVENVGPFLVKQWTEFTQKPYNCVPLKEMQAQAKANNPAAVGMMTGMAAGVRGLAFSLVSLKLEQTAAGADPAPKEVDAVVSLSAKDPAALVQTASAMLPQLAALQIPADGSSVALPLPLQLPFTPMAAINGSHLTVYAGKQGELIAKELGKSQLESSQGIMAAAVDYGKYYSLLSDAMSAMGKDDPKAAEAVTMLQSMKNAKMRVAMSVDFTGRGIEMKANVAPAAE
uniref:hypothetical protein n=1 Tax=Candidatus Electronema sp. TaxID=2698783 RepID=UPI004056B5B0